MYSHVSLLRYALPARVADKQDQAKYEDTREMSGSIVTKFGRKSFDVTAEAAAADEAEADAAAPASAAATAATATSATVAAPAH